MLYEHLKSNQNANAFIKSIYGVDAKWLHHDFTESKMQNFQPSVAFHIVLTDIKYVRTLVTSCNYIVFRS